ncbi:MAG: hypothetical protein U9Q82_10500 [Chloroflexota bacterium]|nr:hypothetical protein [Chloroflexota bacterium]
MKFKLKFRTLLLVTTLEGIACLVFLLIPASEPSSVILLRYSATRLLIVSTIVMVLFGLALLPGSLKRNQKLADTLMSISIKFLKQETYLLLTFFLLSFSLVLIMFLISIWTIIDVRYQGIILRIAPILTWSAIAGIQTIYFLWQWALRKNTLLKKDTLPIKSIKSIAREISLETLAIIILLAAQYQIIPRKYWQYRHVARLYAPLIILGLLVGSRLFSRCLEALKKKQLTRNILIGGVFIGLMVAGFFYYQAAIKHSVLNNVELRADQSNFVHQTKQVYESGFRYTGNRIQMPVYTFMQAVFYDPEKSLAETFYIGKQVNIFLSMILLIVLLLIFKSYLPLRKAFNLTLIIAFSSFIFKAAYFTTEILYYFISFLGFVLLCKMLKKPGITLGIITGIILGIGNLTKASILPGLLIFAAIYVLKEVARWLSLVRKDAQGCSEKKLAKTNLVSLILLLVFFLGVIGPYLRESKIKFGQYFYNPAHIVIWYESWEEALEIREIYHGWHNIPPEETPGPLWYLQKHTLSQIVQRVKYGFSKQFENIRYQFNFFNYPYLFALLAIFVVIVNFRKSLGLFQSNLFLIGFVILYLIGYFLAIVWYSPISCLWRFIYGLHLPFMFSAFISIFAITKNTRYGKFKAIDFTVSIMLVFDIYYVLTEALFLNNFAA